jgi:hypothetical protein
MSTAAVWSDEEKTQEAISKAAQDRQEFLQWWRQWAAPRNADTTWLREMAYEAFKAGKRNIK